MHRRMSRTRWGGAGVGVACAVCVGASTGCYQKITRAEGFGASRISTEKSDLDTPIDNAIFGKPDSAKKSTMPGPGSP